MLSCYFPLQLLYFCATEDPLEGFLRALSLVTGIALPTKEEIDTLENHENTEQHSMVRALRDALKLTYLIV